MLQIIRFFLTSHRLRVCNEFERLENWYISFWCGIWGQRTAPCAMEVGRKSWSLEVYGAESSGSVILIALVAVNSNTVLSSHRKESAHDPPARNVFPVTQADTPGLAFCWRKNSLTLHTPSSSSSGGKSGFLSTWRFQRSSCTIVPSSTWQRILETGSSV